MLFFGQWAFGGVAKSSEALLCFWNHCGAHTKIYTQLGDPEYHSHGLPQRPSMGWSRTLILECSHLSKLVQSACQTQHSLPGLTIFLATWAKYYIRQPHQKKTKTGRDLPAPCAYFGGESICDVLLLYPYFQQNIAKSYQRNFSVFSPTYFSRKKGVLNESWQTAPCFGPGVLGCLTCLPHLYRLSSSGFSCHVFQNVLKNVNKKCLTTKNSEPLSLSSIKVRKLFDSWAAGSNFIRVLENFGRKRRPRRMVLTAVALFEALQMTCMLQIWYIFFFWRTKVFAVCMSCSQKCSNIRSMSVP